MPRFTHDGVEIAFLDEGEGEPIVLVHGFASNKEVNWAAPNWMMTLIRAGRRAIALDNRGHGASTKLYDPAAYHSAIMAEDVRALLDHLALSRADVMGYSMGARIAAFLALAHPDRVRAVVLGGLGIRLVEGVGLPDSIADALEAPYKRSSRPILVEHDDATALAQQRADSVEQLAELHEVVHHKIANTEVEPRSVAEALLIELRIEHARRNHQLSPAESADDQRGEIPARRYDQHFGGISRVRNGRHYRPQHRVVRVPAGRAG